MDFDDYASLRCFIHSQGFHPVKHWAKATVEKTTDLPPEFVNELAFHATRMIIQIMKDVDAEGENFDKADINMVIDFHG